MTDERVSPVPGNRPDETDTDPDEAREMGEDRSRPSTDEGDGNPLTREGPDAPDAADIEDPDEQL